MRYAHLAPDSKQSAVDALVKTDTAKPLQPTTPTAKTAASDSARLLN